MRYLLLISLVMSCLSAHASDTCIKHDGQIVLFALPGCSISPTDPNERLYGFWEKGDGNKEIVCWKYDTMVTVYLINDTTLSFTPADVVTDCPVPTYNRDPSSSEDQKRPTPARVPAIAS